MILGIQAARDAVHLLAHSAEPLSDAASDQRIYGCTAFVFHLAPTELAGHSATALMDRIQAWLASPAGVRVCRGGLERPVGFEP